MTRYILHDGELVSKAWAIVLDEMDKDVNSNVNEGHRTLARQAWFYMCYRTGSCNNGNLAAVPSPWAPHIRTGRIDHAIDFSNDVEVFAWLQNHGLRPVRTVRGESWHIEVPASALREFARRLKKKSPYDTLPKHVEHAVRMLLYHRRQAIDEAKPENGGKGPQYEKHVRRRKFWRARVEGMLKRARREKTKRVLRKVLAID